MMSNWRLIGKVWIRFGMGRHGTLRRDAYGVRMASLLELHSSGKLNNGMAAKRSSVLACGFAAALLASLAYAGKCARGGASGCGRRWRLHLRFRTR